MRVDLNAGIKMSVVAKLRTVLIFILCLHTPLRADPLHISFLNDQGALQNTLAVLKDSGCRSDAVDAFQRAVERYNSTGLRFDLSKFPPAQGGFYSFQSLSRLLALIPHRICDIPHAYEFNCFDTTILLADGQLRTGLHPDEYRGDFFSPMVDTNGELRFYPHVATAREDFNLSCPTWYQNISRDYIPSAMADSRICLTAALYAVHELSKGTTDHDSEHQVMNVLQTSWKSHAIVFPSRFQIVLCHGVNLTNHFFATTHAGVLLAVEKRFERSYVYIEKNGGCGPFVRLDFGNKADLMAWLAWKFDNTQGCLIFVTFNDTKIEKLDIGSCLSAQK
jgi:hypothetical protein